MGSIPTIVRAFKAAVARDFGRKFDLHKVWQRNYYEHIIRDEKEWDRIHRYIESNPVRWAEDDEHPANKQ
jgi:REP element-mobilizing transposase RayT